MLGQDAVELAPLYDQLSIMLFLHEREQDAAHAAQRAMEILEVGAVGALECGGLSGPGGRTGLGWVGRAGRGRASEHEVTPGGACFCCCCGVGTD